MKWIKKGQIFEPRGEYAWMNSHVCPLAAIVLEDRIRVFVSTRTKQDKEGNYVSYPTYLDLDIDDPTKILYLHNKPILELGGLGAFDQYGIMVLKPLMVQKKLYLYYAGWQRLACNKSPYQITVGLAISEDFGKTFKKVSDGPILGIDMEDPVGVGNVFALKKDCYHMYYTSIIRWENSKIKPTILYDIKHAVSDDAIHWKKDGKIIIKDDEKGGCVAPTVFEYDGKYRMLFGYRPAFEADGTTGKYKMGYAESEDLIHWTRKDEEAGLSVSETGWDSEMVCYPHVVQVKDKWLMFYCGNGFGARGFGYAELQQED